MALPQSDTADIQAIWLKLDDIIKALDLRDPLILHRYAQILGHLVLARDLVGKALHADAVDVSLRQRSHQVTRDVLAACGFDLRSFDALSDNDFSDEDAA